jgi:hypothetical protein
VGLGFVLDGGERHYWVFWDVFFIDEEL